MDAGSLLGGHIESPDDSVGVSSGADIGFITNDSNSDPLIFNYREDKPIEKSASSARSTTKKRMPKAVDDEVALDELGEPSDTSGEVASDNDDLQVQQATGTSPSYCE